MLMMLAVLGLLWERVTADADDARCVGFCWHVRQLMLMMLTVLGFLLERRQLMLMMLAVLGLLLACAAADSVGAWHVRQLMLMMLAVPRLVLACAAADADDARCPGSVVGTRDS